MAGPKGRGSAVRACAGLLGCRWHQCTGARSQNERHTHPAQTHVGCSGICKTAPERPACRWRGGSREGTAATADCPSPGLTLRIAGSPATPEASTPTSTSTLPALLQAGPRSLPEATTPASPPEWRGGGKRRTRRRMSPRTRPDTREACACAPQACACFVVELDERRTHPWCLADGINGGTDRARNLPKVPPLGRKAPRSRPSPVDPGSNASLTVHLCIPNL